MKLCFVSVNGPREPYLLDEPRISLNTSVSIVWKILIRFPTLTKAFLSSTASVRELGLLSLVLIRLEPHYIGCKSAGT
jgi:hypothetical protein